MFLFKRSAATFSLGRKNTTFLYDIKLIYQNTYKIMDFTVLEFLKFIFELLNCWIFYEHNNNTTKELNTEVCSFWDYSPGAKK